MHSNSESILLAMKTLVRLFDNKVKQSLSGGTLFIFLTCFSYGQDNFKQIDELNKELWNVVFNNPDSALVLGKQIVKESQRSGYAKGTADAKAKIGVAYDLKGMQEEALPYFLDAIKIQEKIKDSVGLAFTYNNLGLMYYAQYAYEPARKYIERSLEIDRALGNKSEMAGSLINLGIIYTYLDSLDKSLSLYEQSLGIYSQLADSAGIMVVYTNMAKIYFSQKNYKKALEYNLLNEAYLERNPHPERLSAVYNSLANIYLKLNNAAKSIEYAKRDLEHCQTNNLTYRKQFSYETLSDVYSEMGDYNSANVYLKSYVSLRDSILSEDKNARIAEMQVKYESERKDNEILKVKLEKETDAARARKQKTILFVGLLLFAGGLLFVSWAYRSKRRINRLLDEKNKLNEAIIEQKQLMMGEVHHRVKNNLQLISSMIDLESRNVTDDATKSIVSDIQKRVGAISILHQFLYDKDKDSIDKADAAMYLRQLGDGLNKSFRSSEKQVDIHYEVEPLQLGTDALVPIGLIVNELITNSFKYAFTENGGSIFVRLFRKEHLLILEVEDNGKGIKDEPSKSTSFGLTMIRSLCRQLDAVWDVETKNGLKNRFEIKKINYLSDNE